jgi:hypothetical protein
MMTLTGLDDQIHVRSLMSNCDRSNVRRPDHKRRPPPGWRETPISRQAQIPASKVGIHMIRHCVQQLSDVRKVSGRHHKSNLAPRLYLAPKSVYCAILFLFGARLFLFGVKLLIFGARPFYLAPYSFYLAPNLSMLRHRLLWTRRTAAD